MSTELVAVTDRRSISSVDLYGIEIMLPPKLGGGIFPGDAA